MRKKLDTRFPAVSTLFLSLVPLLCLGFMFVFSDRVLICLFARKLGKGREILDCCRFAVLIVGLIWGINELCFGDLNCLV